MKLQFLFRMEVEMFKHFPWTGSDISLRLRQLSRWSTPSLNSDSPLASSVIWGDLSSLGLSRHTGGLYLFLQFLTVLVTSDHITPLSL